MQKKTIIILSIVSSILSLIYIIFSYYGLLRYTSLYMYSSESYQRNYNKLEHGNEKKSKIVVSLSATNIKKIKPLINSILDQTIRVDLIYIVVSPKQKYKLPNNLKNIVFLIKSGKNYREAANLIPILSREEDSSTILITLGNNTIYGKDFLENLLDESKNHHDSVIYVKNNTNKINLNSGSLFKINFFDEEFLNLPTNINPHNWIDNYLKDKPKHEIKYSSNYKII